MKTLRPILWGLLIFLLSLFPSELVGQTAGKTLKSDSLYVKYKTVLERYEADFVATSEQRKQWKKERQELIRFRSAIIDTLPISDRLKRRLRKELYTTPFTDEWSKVMADLEFEDPLDDWDY